MTDERNTLVQILKNYNYTFLNFIDNNTIKVQRKKIIIITMYKDTDINSNVRVKAIAYDKNKKPSTYALEFKLIEKLHKFYLHDIPQRTFKKEMEGVHGK